MSLPITRNTNYSPSDSLKSADMDDLQDMTIGGRHGTIQQCFSLIPGYSTNGGGSTKDAVSPALWSSSGGADWVDRWFELPVGTVITEVYLNCYQGDSAQITWEIQEISPTQAVTVVMSSAGNATTGGPKQITETGAVTIQADRVYRFRAKSNSSVVGDQFDFFSLKYHK